jgi:hypothetical protein
LLEWCCSWASWVDTGICHRAILVCIASEQALGCCVLFGIIPHGMYICYFVDSCKPHWNINTYTHTLHCTCTWCNAHAHMHTYILLLLILLHDFHVFLCVSLVCVSLVLHCLFVCAYMSSQRSLPHTQNTDMHGNA